MTQEAIKELIKQRGEYLKEDKESAADAIEEVIMKEFKATYNDYPCDFIIEILTEFGLAPNVMYDDAGHFAVTSAGYQPVIYDGPISGEFMVFVEKEQWQDTIRKALWYYINTLSPPHQ